MHADAQRRIRFRALPGVFVFPSLVTLGINLLLTEIVESCAAVLSYQGLEQGYAEYLVASIVLWFIGGYLFLALTMLLHFNWRHRAIAWRPAIPAESLTDVDDPLYRLVSKVRVRMCHEGTRHVLIDRSRGQWVHATNETVEPERTERLVARPVALFPGWYWARRLPLVKKAKLGPMIAAELRNNSRGPSCFAKLV